MINRFIELDDLFFEGFGLWVGEGRKDKGLYFGNSSLELLLCFLKFVEEKLGLNRQNFKVTLNVPELENEKLVKKRWSKTLGIPIGNFTKICTDPRITREYAQVYLNSVALVELMKNFWRELEPAILSDEESAIPFLRGIFAAEGSVILRGWGTIHHVNFSSKDKGFVKFLEKCLKSLGITCSKYEERGQNLPIHGRINFEKIKELGIHTSHPQKRAKFELGLSRFKRYQMNGEEARKLILQQLAQGPKTYDELAAALGRARTTIQAWHLPILEREGLVRHVGKREQAWLFGPT